MTETTRYTVAAVQMDPLLKDKAGNLDRSLSALSEAAARGARLVVFPECALTGYIYESLSELLPLAETVPGPTTRRLAAASRETGAYLVYGMAEREGDRAYNSAVLVGPEEGLIGCYRKVHLPPLGVDRLAAPGDRPFQVHETALGRLGLLICYDLRFPESVRSLAIQGADLVLLPTNWPTTSTNTADFMVRARAFENRIYVVACDRVGVERGSAFMGRSQIVDPTGAKLAEASADREEIIYGEVDLALARQKRNEPLPGVWIDALGDRRPEMYGDLVRPNPA